MIRIFFHGLLFVTVFSAKALAFDGLAILGDSMSTGAAANPALEFDSKQLWDIFTGATKLELSPKFFPEEFQKFSKDRDLPLRVGPSVRENDAGSGWLWQNLMQSLASSTVEEHRLTYGYFIGRKIGLPSRDILLAGENGARARRAWVHASRLIGARDRDLPSRIILFYTGNDLCAQSYDDIASAEDYGAGLLAGMKYLVLNGHASARGTSIYIPAFLPVNSLLHEKTILERKIRLQGEEVTCLEAREKFFTTSTMQQQKDKDAPFQLFSALIPPNPVSLCPTMFAPEAKDAARQSLLANRIRAYREAQVKAVQDFNDWRGRKHPAKSFEAVFLEQTGQIRFDGLDVAADCFHLSAQGQGKVASAILKGIK